MGLRMVTAPLIQLLVLHRHLARAQAGPKSGLGSSQKMSPLSCQPGKAKGGSGQVALEKWEDFLGRLQKVHKIVQRR